MKIAYLTNCFGSQSHTFIRREVRALRELSVEICLFGIRRDQGSVAADAEDLVAETTYLYPLSPWRLVGENLRLFVHNPVRYLRGLVRALSSPELSMRRRGKMGYHYLVSASHARRLRDEGVTHVHAHFMNVSASVAMFAAWHARIPYSVTVHSAGTFGTGHILGVAQKLGDAQFLVMISHNNVNYFDAIAPCRSKSHVVRCGMDLTDFPLRDPKAVEQLAARPARLLTVGRFVEKKGFIHLVEAAALLRSEGVTFLLTLIGDGPLLESTKRRARELQLGDVVEFRGRCGTAEVRQAMTAADVVIVPSVTSSSGEKEGLPVVIMEAMATGVPVVASDHSGIPEIVRPGHTGELTPEKDARKIAQAIARVLSRDNSAMIAAARKLVVEEFNIVGVAQQRRALFLGYDET